MSSRSQRNLSLSLAVIAWCVCPSAAKSHADKTGTACRAYRQAGWVIQESANFRVCCFGSKGCPDQVVAEIELMRTRLAEKWLGNQSAAWSPKCDVVLHTSRNTYLQAVPGGEQTGGSSLVESEGGAIVTRRIDIRADRTGWLAGVVAHELTHVVLADVFPAGQVPRWADEGMAVLADTPEKQDLHFQDLRTARAHRKSLRLVQLFTMNDYPAPEHQACFYGQSASVVEYLLERGSPEQFIRFVRAGNEQGYESALRDVYRIQGLGDLERRWNQHVDLTGSIAARDRLARTAAAAKE